MVSGSLRSLILDKLEQGCPGITQSWGKFLAEASSFCLECRKHPQGVELKVHGLSPTSFSVFWQNEITEQVYNAWRDDQEATEYGACGIAILLILELTQYTVIR